MSAGGEETMNNKEQVSSEVWQCFNLFVYSLLF